MMDFSLPVSPGHVSVAGFIVPSPAIPIAKCGPSRA